MIPRRFLGGLLTASLLFLLLGAAPADDQRCGGPLDNRTECRELWELHRQTQELEDQRIDQYMRDLDRKREREERNGWRRRDAKALDVSPRRVLSVTCSARDNEPADTGRRHCRGHHRAALRVAENHDPILVYSRIFLAPCDRVGHLLNAHQAHL